MPSLLSERGAVRLQPIWDVSKDAAAPSVSEQAVSEKDMRRPSGPSSLLHHAGHGQIQSLLTPGKSWLIVLFVNRSSSMRNRLPPPEQRRGGGDWLRVFWFSDSSVRYRNEEWRRGFSEVGLRCPKDVCEVALLLCSGGSEKRSQALRGRNLTRDIRVSDAPKACLASGGFTLPEAEFFSALDIGALP